MPAAPAPWNPHHSSMPTGKQPEPDDEPNGDDAEDPPPVPPDRRPVPPVKEPPGRKRDHPPVEDPEPDRPRKLDPLTMPANKEKQRCS